MNNLVKLLIKVIKFVEFIIKPLDIIKIRINFLNLLIFNDNFSIFNKIKN